MRVVIELKSSAVPEIIKNQLFQYTPLKLHSAVIC